MSKQSRQPNATQATAQTCFVIMPISDHPDYPPDHFSRVYEHIIKPACVKAGFIPDRADDAQHTHVIMMNILQRILDADIVLCDLSTKNPNVLYELGIRQSFDKPVTLIKDDRTSRIFDTGMLSDVEYNADLRVDNVQQAIETIAARLRNTFEKRDEKVNSLIQLMKIRPAAMPEPTTISTETKVILDAINTLGRRVSGLEGAKVSRSEHKQKPHAEYFASSRQFFVTLNDTRDKAEAFSSVFADQYPVASSVIVEMEDGSLVLEFTFNEEVSVHIPTLDEIGSRVGVKRGATSILPFRRKSSDGAA
ncbi:MAG: hypothetical protein ACJ74T_01930 [Pyrinomonadaceae bacterium]